jgi:hypothetical protein
MTKTCTIENCNEPHMARGLCNNHFKKWAGTHKKCMIKNCNKRPIARKMCNSHYRKWARKHLPDTSKKETENRKRYIKNHPDFHAKKRIRYRSNEENRIKQDARDKFHSKVRFGKIKRQPCEICGAPNACGHHDDYSKPYVVRWLCVKHHIEFHQENP